MPDDARYRVARFRWALLRAGQVLQTASIEGAQVNLASWYSHRQPSDSLRIDVLRVERQSFRRAVVPVPMPAQMSFKQLY